MAQQIQINKGDTLSALASKYGTTVADIMTANKSNPAVKSADMIIAGGNLNLPEKVALPASGPAVESPAGALDTAGTQAPAAQSVSSLANLRIALRSALEEAGKNRMANAYGQAGALTGGVPGTLGSVVDMIRQSTQPAVESVYNTTVAAWREDMDAKEKEKSRIQELRLEYGSAIPAGVTSLDDAIAMITPLVDKERAMKLSKMQEEQSTDNDIESWAQAVADGSVKITSVPSNIRTAVQVRSAALAKENQDAMSQELKDRMSYLVGNGLKTYEDLRNEINIGGSIGNFDLSTLTTAEMNDYIKYLDDLEAAENVSKATAKQKKREEDVQKALNPLMMMYGSAGTPS